MAQSCIYREMLELSKRSRGRLARVNKQRSWICNGEPKDGKQHSSSGPHPPHENNGPDCEVCGLPSEAMEPSRIPPRTVQPTVVSGGGTKTPFPILPFLIAAGVLLALGAAFALYKIIQHPPKTAEIEEVPGDRIGAASRTAAPPQADPQALVSETAANAQLISQGEKILLPGAASAEKKAGAAAFAQKNWEEAIAQYQKAATANPNDPESKIYLNNAIAKKAGNPLTMAVVVPIAASADVAKEVLRGVAQAQDEFNKSPKQPGQLLEVAIANDTEPKKAADLAKDLIASPNVLGVMGHGVDNDSRQAIALYEDAGITVLSPISTSITPGSGSKSTLKTISVAEKANELLGNYLQTVGETLAKYANQKSSPASVVVFYNSDSPYSQQLKQQFTAALSKVKGKVVKEVDVSDSNFNAASEVTSASSAGAKLGFLALSKNKVDRAVAIAKANTSGGAQLLQLIGSDELYNPTILQQGGDAIKGIVLAVPWSSQPNDPFAQSAANIWKGRVSWRTATAYDATKALASAFSQNPSRSGVVQLLKGGIPIGGTATDFNVLSEVPLVKAVPGSNGPPGSKYQFDPI